MLGAIALAACATKPVQPEKLNFHSADVGFTQIDMRATETKRNAQASVLEFEDLNPDKGSKLTKGVFRLRSAATVAARRGHRYFVILNKAGDDEGLLIGLLPSQDADFGDVFGEKYADVSRQGILDADKLGPLQLP
jgi:hypothetical protein